MTNPVDTIRIYESMALISEQMLTAARDANFELLSMLENRSVEYLGQLNEQAGCASLENQIDKSHDSLSARKVAIIKKILAEDLDIRNLTEKHLSELSNVIKNNKNECKLAHRYSVNPKA